MARAGGSGSARSPRATVRTLFGASISSRSSGRTRTWPAGRTTGTRSSAAPCAARMARSSAPSRTSTGSARPRSSPSTAAPVGSFDLPAVRAFIRIFAPRRGEIVVDADALDLRPSKSRTPDPDRPKAPRRRSRKPAGDRHAALRTGSRRMTLEIDILTLFPAMIRGPLSESIPGRIQEQGLATITVRDLRDWGLGRHRSVDDTPYGGGAGMILRPGAGRRRPRRPPSTGFGRHPARPGRRGLPPGACRGPCHAVASRLRLPALRGRRRADPVAGRSGAVDRRLRPDRRRTSRAGRHRCGHPAPARGDRGRIRRRRVVLRRVARVSAVHPPARLSRDGGAGHPDVRRSRRRRALAARTGRDTHPGAPGRPPAGRRRPGARLTRRGAVLYSAADAPSASLPMSRPAATAAQMSQEPTRDRARRDRPGPASHRPARTRHR